jgi:hypothetical protein
MDSRLLKNPLVTLRQAQGDRTCSAAVRAELVEARYLATFSQGSLLLCLYLCLLPVFAGCGRKTAVQPPELVAPEAIADLSARSETKGIYLRWSRPLEYAGGSQMEDLAGFVVLRAMPGATVQSNDFKQIATVTVEDRDRFRRAKKFSHLDSEVDPKVLYRYQVLAFTLDADYSAASNTAEAVWEGGP